MSSLAPAIVARAAAVVLTAALVLTGCSTDDRPDALPAIDTTLSRIDRALASGDLAGARTALELLVELTEDAESDGRLDDATATEVLAAAEALEEQLAVYAAAAPEATRPDAEQAAVTRPADEQAQPRTTAPAAQKKTTKKTKKPATKKAVKKAAKKSARKPAKKTGPPSAKKKPPGAAKGKGKGKGRGQGNGRGRG